MATRIGPSHPQASQIIMKVSNNYFKKSKSETKIFILKKNFHFQLQRNSKFEILLTSEFFSWNLSGIGNKKNFDIEGSPLWIFQEILVWFLNWSELKDQQVAGHYSRCQNIIKVGPKIDFEMASDRPRPLQFLARLQTNQSTVPPPPPQSTGLAEGEQYLGC